MSRYRSAQAAEETDRHQLPAEEEPEDDVTLAAEAESTLGSVGEGNLGGGEVELGFVALE